MFLIKIDFTIIFLRLLFSFSFDFNLTVFHHISKHLEGCQKYSAACRIST